MKIILTEDTIWTEKKSYNLDQDIIEQFLNAMYFFASESYEMELFLTEVYLTVDMSHIDQIDISIKGNVFWIIYDHNNPRQAKFLYPHQLDGWILFLVTMGFVFNEDKSDEQTLVYTQEI